MFWLADWWTDITKTNSLELRCIWIRVLSKDIEQRLNQRNRPKTKPAIKGFDQCLYKGGAPCTDNNSQYQLPLIAIHHSFFSDSDLVVRSLCSSMSQVNPQLLI